MSPNGLVKRSLLRFEGLKLTKPLTRPSLLIRLLLGVECMGFCDGAAEKDLRACWKSCWSKKEIKELKEKNDGYETNIQDRQNNGAALLDYDPVQLRDVALEVVAKGE
jgi:hypothetical protein